MDKAAQDRSAVIDRELAELRALGEEIVKRAQKGGATVAECMLRTGGELSVRVRMGKTELVEEAGTRAAGLRLMKGKRVASTSTSDLTPQGVTRFIEDALELCEISQEDSFAGPVDPKLLGDPAKGVDLDLYDPSGGAIDAASAIGFASKGEAAARAFDTRISNSEGGSFSRTSGGGVLVLSSGFTNVTKGSYQSLSVVPLAEDEGGKKRRGYHWTARRHLAELEAPEAVGREAARRTLRKLGARPVATGEFPVVFDPDAARAILGLMAGAVMGILVLQDLVLVLQEQAAAILPGCGHILEVEQQPQLKAWVAEREQIALLEAKPGHIGNHVRLPRLRVAINDQPESVSFAESPACAEFVEIAQLESCARFVGKLIDHCKA